MAERSCVVLVQNRYNSEYNDFIGKYYHFPKKYFNLLNTSGLEFVYYETKTKGEAVYFGYGKLGKTFPDKRENDCYFIEILDYKPFSTEIPFLSDDGSQRESGPTYNPQNAVRRVSPEILDSICLDGGILLSFKADAHLIRVLGEQLIASEKVGILELIKNSYDANASYCNVLIENVNVPSLPTVDRSRYRFPDLQGPVIVVEDDGVGMNKEVIENGWLRPASTLKTEIKERLKREKLRALETDTLGTYTSLVRQLKREHGNRIPLGEKGVGRFATHRLGKKLILRTKVRGTDYEYVLKIDWSHFDQISTEPIDLDSIGVSLQRSKPSRDYGERDSGTQLIIYGGKEGFSWDREAIDDLNRSVLSLNSPQPGRDENKESDGPSKAVETKTRKGFKASLSCPQIPDLPRVLTSSHFDPVLSFDGLVDENGVLDYDLTFNPPQSVPMVQESLGDKFFDLKKSDKDYWKKNSAAYRNPECGSFFLHVDVWYRDKPWIDGPDAHNFIEFLTNFGGISVYRDNIIIFPAEWGAETDWLELTTRHIKKGWSMSYYNMIGNVEIDQTKNLDLIDKTDRQGLIQNRAYADLVHLIRAILLYVIEIQFIGKRDTYSKLTKGITKDPKTLAGYTRDASRLVSGVLRNYPIDEDPHSLLNHLGNEQDRKERLVNLERSIKNLQKSLKLIEEEKDLLTELAGYGLAIGVSVHEITKITANFYYGITELLKKRSFDATKLRELRDSSFSLQSELKRLSPLRAIRSERRTEFSILRPIEYAAKVFGRRFQKLGILFEVNSNKEFPVYTRLRLIRFFPIFSITTATGLTRSPNPSGGY